MIYHISNDRSDRSELIGPGIFQVIESEKQTVENIIIFLFLLTVLLISLDDLLLVFLKPIIVIQWIDALQLPVSSPLLVKIDEQPSNVDWIELLFNLVNDRLRRETERVKFLFNALQLHKYPQLKHSYPLKRCLAFCILGLTPSRMSFSRWPMHSL